MSLSSTATTCSTRSASSADGAGPGGLERSRLALLNFLAESLEPAEMPRTTVVFDAREAPPGPAADAGDHRGLTVRFAARDDDADTLIEELIRADSAPRRLTVVSSDHRLQRAAHRRRARAVDSDVWYAEVVAAAAPTGRLTGRHAARPWSALGRRRELLGAAVRRSGSGGATGKRTTGCRSGSGRRHAISAGKRSRKSANRSIGGREAGVRG